MKKSVVLFVLLYLFTGCIHHDEFDGSIIPEESAPTAPTHITASLGELLSRVAVQNDQGLYWNEGDAISFFFGQDVNLQYSLLSESDIDEESGIFSRLSDDTISGEKIDYNYAIYPYAETTKVTADGEIIVQLPEIQNYADNSFGKGAVTLVAISEKHDTEMHFNSVVGYIKLQLYGENAIVKRIEFRGNSNEKLAGEAVVTASLDGTYNLVMGDSTTKVVTLDCGEGVEVSADATKPTAFWLALPPQLFSEGFQITIYDDKGNSYTKTTSESYSIDCNVIQQTKAIDIHGDLDIVALDRGKTLFYLLDNVNNAESPLSLVKRDWSTSTLLVNGEVCDVNVDSRGLPYTIVNISENDNYEAVILSEKSVQWYEENPYNVTILPPSQFESISVETISSFPIYATHLKENGSALIFNNGFALLHLRLRGTADIVSVRAETSSYDMAGKVAQRAATGEFVIEHGTNFVALNCTNEGRYTTLDNVEYHDFYLMIAAGDYSDGLKITVADRDYKAMFYDLTDVKLAAGEVYTIEDDYAPSEDMIFYEGFDNCVWGGDIMRGSEGVGFAPNATKVTTDNELDRTGYEQALTMVEYDNAGSAFIQQDSVAVAMVGSSHQVSNSYILSRNLAANRHLFRCQEYPGYIAVGDGGPERGAYLSPMFSNMKDIGSCKVKIRFAFHAGFNGDPKCCLRGVGGVAKSIAFDGNNIPITSENCTYSGTSMVFHLSNFDISIAANVADKKVWHTLEFEIDGVADGTGTGIYFIDNVEESGACGIYIDRIEAWRSKSWQRKSSTLRVIMWNIQNGMWADQHNNYDNFVKWVEKWNADVCMWCESSTLYEDKTNVSTTSRYLPDGWGELAQRYGHNYAEIGGKRDGYPQTVTSKYPIIVEQRITDTDVVGKPVSHGAGHFSIVKDGKKINVVTMHMWPQAYGYGVTGVENREESAKNREGDYYREFEMQYIVDKTIKNEQYANEKYWVIGGDANSASRLDIWYYKCSEDLPALFAHDILLSTTDFKDVIGHHYFGHFLPTTVNDAVRIDIMYASPALYKAMDNSAVLIDNWVLNFGPTPYVPNFYHPSDHRPIIVDFDLSKVE